MAKFLINSLSVECPELSLDWHPDKNLPLTPMTISFGSAKKVWWKCHDCQYEWEAYIANRRKQYKYPGQKGTKCPNCIGRVINENNSFASHNPDLIKEWNTDKNLPTLPNEISKTSNIKYWWICGVCENEWMASTANRSCGSGCPLCAEFKNRKPNTISKRWKQMNQKLILKSKTHIKRGDT